jgi:hypothetical protein
VGDSADDMFVRICVHIRSERPFSYDPILSTSALQREPSHLLSDALQHLNLGCYPTRNSAGANGEAGGTTAAVRRAATLGLARAGAAPLPTPATALLSWRRALITLACAAWRSRAAQAQSCLPVQGA